MTSLIGDKKSLKQKARENKRVINRSIREIDREINRLKREKKKTQNEATRLAKQGSNAAVKHLCKDIIRMNDTNTKYIQLKALLRQLSAKVDCNVILDQTILKAINKSYKSVSNGIKLPELSKMIQENLLQSEYMEMKQDMICDAMDDAVYADSDDEEQLVQQIMDEIGLEMNNSLASAPKMSMQRESCEDSGGQMQRRLVEFSSAVPMLSSALISRFKVHSASSSTIGLSVGGAKDVNNFRECIGKNVMPSVGSITYNGLLYEYYFNTKTRKHVESIADEKKDDGSKLFYPSYCYAKCVNLNFLDLKTETETDEYEYFMSVGLNSNIRMDEFKRKHLNLTIVLDKSGSMSSRWDNKSKMQVANESVVALLKHLTVKDRFALVTFESKAVTMQGLKFINDVDMNELKKRILSITHSGGTNFECGYLAAINLYQALFSDGDYKLNSIDDEYDNRIIFLTDARPNSGRTDEKSLFGMVQKYAENKPSFGVECDENEYIRNRIYTTFIGIGVDFNSNLIESISKTRGCNYYSVKSSKDFMDKMDEEFIFMVTPLVFNVCLKINCEGNQCRIDKVYGSSHAKSKEIIENGEISRIHSLFPSKRRPQKKGGGTKGGIQLIKLKKLKNDNNNMNVELIVMFEDRNGKKYRNEQIVTFKSQTAAKPLIKNDMIENDEDEKRENNNENINFYDNTGIRKGILVCKYVELMLEWIKNTKCKTLKVDEKYKKLFVNFMAHFKQEMVKCNDKDLQKELDLMQKLVNLKTITTTNANNNNANDGEYDWGDLSKRLAMLK